MVIPFTEIGKIIDLLMELLKIRANRRNKIFTMILEPMFNQVENVHNSYRNLFLTSMHELPYRDDGGIWRIPKLEFRKADMELAIKEKVNDIKREFTENREIDFPLRDKLRIYAREILMAVNEKPEKRFLVAIIYYFLEEPITLIDDHVIDVRIEMIEELGGRHALDTPSSRLAGYIDKKEDPEELFKIFDSALRALDTKFKVVSKAFMTLKLNIVQHT